MNRGSSRYFIGFIIIFVGAYFMAQNFGFAMFPTINIWEVIWPSLFIYWGFEALRNKNEIGAAFLLIIGANFLLEGLGFNSFGWDLIGRSFFPILLILIGFKLLTRDKSKNRGGRSHSIVIDRERRDEDRNVRVTSTERVEREDGHHYKVNLTKERNDDSKASSTINSSFKHSKGTNELSSIFNSKKYYFKYEDFKTGDNFLDLTCIFGEMKVVFPKNVNIKFMSNVTLGECNFLGEKFDGFVSKHQEDYYAIDSSVTVVVYATVLFGEMKIKVDK